MTKRVTLHIAMTSGAGSEQTADIEPDDLPDGWDTMTEEQRDEALADHLQAHLANHIDMWWTEQDN